MRSSQIAKANGLITHMDGARLLNACVATGIIGARHGRGLGFGLDRFLKGPRRADRRRDCRHRAPSSTRSGAGSSGSADRCGRPASAPPACVYALDHHVDRLADDHANARALARGLSQIDGIEVQQPETNLVFFKPDGAGVSGDKMVEALRQRGVLLAMMDGRIRACTHLDVSAAMIEETVGIVREIVREA